MPCLVRVGLQIFDCFLANDRDRQNRNTIWFENPPDLLDGPLVVSNVLQHMRSINYIIGTFIKWEASKIGLVVHPSHAQIGGFIFAESA